ncbi:MAG: tetratricopeptide repeat protein [Candidatus Solibacter usitatus]|nr:tetratricopeptide repeat protein [Candidatus Solibacter usitatus]
MRKILLSILFVANAAGAAQAPPQKKARDLRFEVDESIDKPMSGKVAVPRSYALVIGVSQYKNLESKLQLKFTERDAEAVYSILISKEGGNFRAENVHKLVGEKATLANVRKELEEWLPSVSKEDDRVLIYFAGHGFVFNGKVYLAPSDFDMKNPSRTGYSTEDLGAAFGSKIKGKWKVLLTDACHSGAVTSDTDVRTINTRLLDVNRSLYSLTASRDREQSFESPEWGGGHGIFTYYVIKGMEGEADESKDGIVTADELTAYVQRNVRDASGGRQNPTVGGSFDNAMLLGYNPSGATTGKPPEPKFGRLVFMTNMDNVEVFLDGKSQGVANKGTPLSIPGLTPGVHQVKGVRMGYEPDGPREEMVYPGQDTTVNIKMMIPRRRPKAALDKFDPAVERYEKAKGPEDYRRAVADFKDVLAIDPTYSQAAMFLARSYRDLNEYEQATKYFQRALELDPDYTEARATYGGMLFDTGSTDEAIRMLNAVVQRDPNSGMAWYLLAQAFRIKEAYDQSIDAARNAIRVAPNNAEAHFWLAEGLRMKVQFADAIPEYQAYLKLSYFESNAMQKLGYYAIGFKFFRKKRAGTTDVWRELRSLAYFGLCNCEMKLNHYDNAITYCQKSLSFDKGDPYAHHALALSYMKQAVATGDAGLLVASRKNFSDAISINPDLELAAEAKANIKNIDAFFQSR